MKAIRHVGIVVSNLERSLSFYQDLLGLKIVKRTDESGEYLDRLTGLKTVKATTVKMAADDGNLIELLYYKPYQKFNPKNKLNKAGVSHIAFTVENVDREYRRLSKKNVSFNSIPVFSPDGYAKVVFCRDPDGVFIELVEILKKTC